MRRLVHKTLSFVIHKIPWKPILIWGPWVVILLVVSFYAFENWRGKRAWEKAQAMASEAGVSTNFQDYIPPFPDDDFDASSLPILDGSGVRSFKKRVLSGDPGFNGASSWKDGFRKSVRWKSESRDIRLWLDQTNGPLTKREAADQLWRLAQSDLESLRDLSLACEGRKLVFRPPTVRPSLSESRVSLMPLLRAMELGGEGILLSIAQNDSDQVFLNLNLILSLATAETYPSLVSFLVQSTGFLTFEQALWEAIVSRSLTENHLHRLETRLSQIDLEKQGQRVLKGELGLSLAYLKNAQENRDELDQLLFFPDLRLFTKIDVDWSPASETFEKIDEFLIQRIPKGWIDSARADLTCQCLEMQKTFQEHGFRDIGNNKNEDLNFFAPGYRYTKELLPFFYKTIARGIHYSCKVRISRLGIALELYQRENGRYPKSLSDLSGLDDEVVIDPFSDQPFQYRLKADGTPLLWSIGANGVDEDGLPGLQNKEGDVVWQLTPISGLTEAEWKKRLKLHRLK